MGTMTGAQMESEIKANLGNRSDLDSRLYIFLNWAQEQIARSVYLRELEDLDTSKATVTDQDYVAKPTGLRDLMSFRLLDSTSSRKLTWVPRRRYDEWFAKPDEYVTARSEFFTTWGANFYFWRVPDAAYSLRIAYTKWPTAFATASGEVSDITYMDELIILMATLKAFRSLKNFDPKVIAQYKSEIREILVNAKMYDKELYVDEELKGLYVDNRQVGDYWLDPFVRRGR